MTSLMDVELDYIDSIAAWCLDESDRWTRLNHPDRAIELTRLAARVLSGQNRTLVAPRIESNIAKFALQCADAGQEPAARERSDGHKSFLHVLTQAFPTGGHTAMAVRWIEADRSAVHHSVALLNQKGPVPDKLARAISAAGGTVYTGDPGTSALKKATWLRALAGAVADYVVLHIDMDDIVAATAFGRSGGPPVLLVNHAAHIFWAGASIADAVANCRGSELETRWTTEFRGVPRCVTIPIPLSDTAPVDVADAARMSVAKQRLGVPSDAFVILTVGEGYKYTPFGVLDFPAVAGQILERLPDAYLVAVGVEETEEWRRVSETVAGRLRAVGRHVDLAPFHAAADLYVEGFPFGSTTALLEAGLQGIAVVLAPAECPPPYASDGIALDHIAPRPDSLAAYVETVVALANDHARRAALAATVSASIRQHHTGAGWRQLLREALRRLPAEHRVYTASSAPRTPVAVHRYWAEFRRQTDTTMQGPLETVLQACLTAGIRPRLSVKLIEACRRARTVRVGRAVPLPVLRLLGGTLAALAPVSILRDVLRRAVYSFHRNGRAARIYRHFVPDNRW